MTLKEKLLQDLRGLKVKIKYFAKSPYQKNRYKPEFVDEEAWVYTGVTRLGYCIMGEDYANEEYRKNLLDTIKAEAETLLTL